jgi:membrane associated rhomboid family serine protease
MIEQPEPRPSLFPPVIRFLLIANVVVFLLQLVALEPLLVHFALWPVGTPDVIQQNGEFVWVPPFQVWQLLTYGFLHGSLLHLFLNLFAMWMLGVQLENAWGSRLFAIYYFVCVIGAGFIQLLWSPTG